jgi:signal transduction histidine kinase
MLKELLPENNKEHISTELVEIDQNEIDKKVYEYLKIPLKLEHTYLNEDTPSIDKIYKIVNSPNHYIITDSLCDKYLIGLTLSKEEQNLIKELQKEYDNLNFLAYEDKTSEFPKREIYRLNVEINEGKNIKKEQIEISYSRKPADS